MDSFELVEQLPFYYIKSITNVLPVFWHLLRVLETSLCFLDQFSVFTELVNKHDIMNNKHNINTDVGMINWSIDIENSSDYRL